MKNAYEILTPDGFKPFNGILQKTSNEIIQIKTNDFDLSGTPDHLVETDKGFVELSALSIGDKVKTKNTFQKISVISKEESHPVLVYDVLDIPDIHCYFTNGIVSHNCEFLGSSNTLISGDCLERLSYKDPIYSDNYNYLYYKPEPDHSYVCFVDVGEGAGRDYSVINVIDITEKPYQQVYVYRRNDLSPWLLTPVLIEIATQYNQAYIQVENNSVGKIVADTLFYEYDYENTISSKLFKGEEKFAEYTTHGLGVRMDKKTKIMGCSALKTLIEENMLIVCDWSTIQELFCFVKAKTSYAAEKGKSDDIVMTLVHFGWLSIQTFFENLSKPGIYDIMKEINQKNEDERVTAFGFFSDGTEDLEHSFIQM